MTTNTNTTAANETKYIVNVTLHPDASGSFPWEVRTPRYRIAAGFAATYADAEASAHKALDNAKAARARLAWSQGSYDHKNLTDAQLATVRAAIADGDA